MKDHTELCTLCYLIRKGRYLMLHRIKKENDINRDKWIGVGGHFEAGESPEECVRREVKEETGYELLDQDFRGIVTFVYRSAGGDEITEYMHLFTSENFSGEEIECAEGNLEWIPIPEVTRLPIWEGDRIFLRLLEEGQNFFSLKLVYEGDFLVRAELNGRNLVTVQSRPPRFST